MKPMPQLVPRVELVIAACLCLIAGSPARAQSLPQQRRVDPLFGPAGSGARQSLDLVLTGATASNAELPPPGSEGADISGPALGTGPYQMANASLAYGRRGRRLSLVATARSTAQYYPVLTDAVGLQHVASVGLQYRRAGTELTVSQMAGVFPLYSVDVGARLFEQDLGELPLIAPSALVARAEARRYLSAVGLNQEVGSRLSVRLAARLRDTTFPNGTEQLRDTNSSGRLIYHVTRHLGLVAGYEYQEGTYGFFDGTSPTRTVVNNIDLGLNYSRALSMSRRTSLGFSSGTAVVEDVRGIKRYYLIGDARLNREIGRTWHATGAYHRGVSFIDGFRAPFLADTVAVNIGGRLNRRANLTMGGTYWYGQTQFIDLAGPRPQKGNVTYNALASLRVAISQRVALLTEYSFYHDQFESAPSIIVGFPPQTNRHSVRVGLDVWLPLLR